MTREILSRGKRLDNKRYGVTTKLKPCAYIFTCPDGSKKLFIHPVLWTVPPEIMERLKGVA